MCGGRAADTPIKEERRRSSLWVPLNLLHRQSYALSLIDLDVRDGVPPYFSEPALVNPVTGMTAPGFAAGTSIVTDGVAVPTPSKVPVAPARL